MIDSIKYRFPEDIKSNINEILLKAIHKYYEINVNLIDQTSQANGSHHTKSLINLFIRETEQDVECLKLAGRYKYPLNRFSSQLAERFISLLGIEPTPTKGNAYSSILLICFECAGVVNQDANVYRYAKAGIENIHGNKSDVYKLLSINERSRVESAENADKIKKQSITIKRNTSMKQTLKGKEKAKRK